MSQVKVFRNFALKVYYPGSGFEAEDQILWFGLRKRKIEYDQYFSRTDYTE